MLSLTWRSLKRVVRPILGAFAVVIANAAHAAPPDQAAAQPLTIERLFDSPALTGPTPIGVKVSPDGTRVGFLRSRPDDQYQFDLWEVNLHDHATRLLVDSKRLAPTEQLSDEEKARRERQRSALRHGILDYDWSPDGSKVLVPIAGALYLVDLKAAPGTAPRKLLDDKDGAALDPKISPRGRYVSFVRGQNLHVLDLTTGETRALTHDGAGTLHNAEAEFVAQEEMDQTSGYWWAPDDSSIAFKQYDESPVPVSKRFEVYADRTEVIEQRYPAAGERNVTVKLGLVTPDGRPPRWIDLGAEADIYLARVDWLPDGKAVSFQRQSRDQKRLDLVVADVATLATHMVHTETAATWVELNDDLHFLRRQPAFVWTSSAAGHTHLQLRPLQPGAPVRALTAGDWDVDKVLAVDEAAGLVYFTANLPDPTQQQLYSVHLDGRDSGLPKRLTTEPGWHALQFAQGSDAKAAVRIYVDTYNSPGTPPQTSVHTVDGRRAAWIEENRYADGHPAWPFRAALTPPEFGSLVGPSGEALHYKLVKPPGFDPARRYPVFLQVYGGPHAQLVQQRWDSGFDRYMAQQGYLVFTLDNRGSARRSRAFKDAIYHRLGEVEVQDQLAGVHWLKQQPWVDPARVGVFGWSYGGYMTLMLLAKASPEFAAGVAVAPVTDWRLYDTHYTEQFLGTPAENADGYAQSGVLDQVPGIRSPLLLVHGMADDNVLFTNSTKLMSAMQQHGTRFELMTYPGGKHGLSTPAMQRHVYHQIADFMDRHLKAADAAR